MSCTSSQNLTAVTRGAAVTRHGPDAAPTLVGVADLAALLGMSESSTPALRDVRFPVRRLLQGDVLYRAGDAFDTLYTVRCGFFKTQCVDEGGSEQVLSFPMRGELLGLDGIGSGQYGVDALALDTSEVVVMPFRRFASLSHDEPSLERLLYRLLSRELGRTYTLMHLLGSLTAEARVASFLLDLSERFGRMGFSRNCFVLRMTRHEIGSYLGLKLETVSRLLSSMASVGLIAVDGKAIKLLDPTGLRRLLDVHEEAPLKLQSVARRHLAVVQAAGVAA
jgi:CRP/FNR family transcriptional regulator, anaerobic regulatory protein